MRLARRIDRGIFDTPGDGMGEPRSGRCYRSRNKARVAFRRNRTRAPWTSKRVPLGCAWQSLRWRCLPCRRSRQRPRKGQSSTPRSRILRSIVRARVTVVPRSFLDAGTEVLPGDRKFTDYAFPVGTYSTPLSVVQNTGGRVGWHRSPLPGPFDLPSRYNPFG